MSARRTPAAPARAGALVALAVAAVQATAQSYTPYPMTMHDDAWYGLFNAEQLEYRTGDGEEALRWEAHGWYGGGLERVWLRSEGEHGMSAGDTALEVQLLGSRLVAPFWEVQAGLRYDREIVAGPDPDLAYAVFGVQGTAPYRFDTTAALFLSDEGDLSARLTSLRELRITQRWSVQGRFEIEAASGASHALGIGAGINGVELGLRLRYQVRRELVPYVGVHWERRLGETADLARRDGGGAGDLQLVGGVAFWF